MTLFNISHGELVMLQIPITLPDSLHQSDQHNQDLHEVQREHSIMAAFVARSSLGLV